MSYQSIINTMRVGFMAYNYPIPEGVSEPDKMEWVHRRAAELGCDCLQMRYPYETHSADTVALFRGWMETYGMEYDIHVMLPIFKINQAGGEEIAAELRRRCRMIRELGMNNLRSGYGGLKIESSRFAKSAPDAAQQKIGYVEALRTCAKILEEEEVYLAVENHCDFTGKEQAAMFDAVDSPFVGCAMDTANGLTVYADPDDDIEVLAQYAFTTHMKDFEVLQETVPGRIPFFANDCTLGNGIVDLPRAIDLFAKRSPFRKGLHLIIETGWDPKRMDLTKAEQLEAKKKRIDDGVAYLLRLRKNNYL